MKNLSIAAISIILMFSASSAIFAHDKEDLKDSIKAKADTSMEKVDTVEGKVMANEPKEAEHVRLKDIRAKFSEFPNLHPLIVHFPIVLLLLAVLSQIAGLFVFRYELSYVTMVMLAAGFLGAILATTLFHAHAAGLPEKIHEVFEKHESFAEWTVWLSGIGLGAKLISHFFLKRKLIPELVVLLILLGSAYTVSITGHLGSQLVHIDAVGVQGHYVVKEDND